MTRPDPLESALLSAWNNSEPDRPECHLCGNPKGPWLPDPSGDRWPSGAQKLICSRGCPEAPVEHAAAKDTQDGTQPPAGASTLDSGVYDLLAAIRDALDMPYPVRDDHGRGLHVVMNRAAVVQGALEAILGGTARPENTVVPIRNGIARHPITYTVAPRPEDGGAR